MPGLLENKVALVTGASRGIGAAVAKRLGQEGAHVILVARTVGALEEVDDVIRSYGGSATILPLDLKKLDSIDAIGGILYQKFSALDIFVGNAAILGDLTPIAHLVPKVWDDVMTVNVSANYRFIRTLDPLLRQAPEGKAIFVTSGVTQHHFPFWGAYAASKAALETLVCTYAEETKNTSLSVNLIDPGIVRTAMRAAAMPGEDASILPLPEDITDIFMNVINNNAQITGTRVCVM